MIGKANPDYLNHVQAMNAIDRGNYVLDPSDAYEDAPQLGAGDMDI